MRPDSKLIDGAFASNLIGPDAMAITELFLPFNKILVS